jgi:hypothetical protein
VEVLLALVVIGLTSVALLGAFGTSISASAEHKDQATLDSVLKAFVEQATFQLGRQTASLPKFAACATKDTYSGVTIPTVTSSQGNYTASITSVSYWQPNNSWGSSCTATATPSQQQLLTATATNTTTGTSQSVDFVVSDPPTTFNPAPPGAPAFSGVFADTVATSTPSSFSVSASGSPAPALSASGQPSWVLLVDDGGGNGTLFLNAPNSASGHTYTFTVSATNTYNGGTTVNHTFTVTAGQLPSITSDADDAVLPGISMTPFTVNTTGTPTPSLAETGMPSWATFTDNMNGTATISTTGANVPVAGTYTFMIGAQNGAGSVSQTFTLLVSAAASPAFTTASGDAVPINEAFSFTISATGAPDDPTISESGALPIGVTFTGGTDSATLSGTPTVAGLFPITMTATNSGGTVTQSFLLTVNPQSTPTISNPTNSAPACAQPSKTFQFTVTGTGFQPGATVSSGGMPGTVIVIVVDSSHLTVVGTASSTSNAYQFVVTNPDGGAVTSPSGAFSVVNGQC